MQDGARFDSSAFANSLFLVQMYISKYCKIKHMSNHEYINLITAVYFDIFDILKKSLRGKAIGAPFPFGSS